MSGTVLSTLCSICHTEPPKYKCPRCGARTCSVPCIQKHKARADCDGVRNPRAFMPLNQLKTDSGIDHDFNFLSSIERARQRAEKDVVEARRLLSEKDLRPRNEDKLFQKVWYGDELHHVPVQAQPYKKHGRPQEGPAFIDGFDKHVRRRLRFLGIDVITMPKGMARQRDNKTAFNRRTQTINWQVEWFVHRASELGFPASKDQGPLRISYKSLEGTSLNEALATTLDWRRGQLDRQSRDHPDPTATDDEADADLDDRPKNKQKTHNNTTSTKHKKFLTAPPSICQNPSTTTWPAARYTSQYPLTSAWSQTTTAPHTATTLEEQLATWQFFLVKAVQSATDPSQKTSAKTRTLVPLSSTENLTSVLRGRAVVEFPTLLVLPPGVGVPVGYVIGTFERKMPKVRAEMGVGDGEGGAVGNERAGGYNNTNNNRKRGFDGGRDNKSWKRDRGRGTGANATGVFDREGGRGGKRVRFDQGRQATGRQAVSAEEEVRSEGEEGEVNSDGDEVMYEAADGRLGGHGMVVDGGFDGSGVSLGKEGEVQEGPEGGRPRGGLVDYGSSDDSE